MNVDGISIPDSKLAREITELVRDTESPLLFNHSSRVYYFGALAGNRWGLMFDRELLYAGAMFHDMGLIPEIQQREGAIRGRWRECRPRLPERSWDFDAGHRYRLDGDRAAHDTGHPAAHAPGYRPRDGRRGDGRSRNYLSRIQRRTARGSRRCLPRPEHFKEDIIQAFYDGIKHKPETTFGNVKADVLVDKDTNFRRGNFCNVIRGSLWNG